MQSLHKEVNASYLTNFDLADSVNKCGSVTA